MGVIVRQKVRGRGQPWWVFVNRNHRCTSKKVGDRRAAEAVASVLREQLKAGELNLVPKSAQRTPLFREYAAQFLETYAKTHCKQNTWRGYETIIAQHLNPDWRHRPPR